MEEFFKSLMGSLPVGVMMIVGIAVIYTRVKEVCHRLEKLEDQCNKRLKWCIDHFDLKSK